jgi:hypothetical protein
MIQNITTTTINDAITKIYEIKYADIFDRDFIWNAVFLLSDRNNIVYMVNISN